MRQHLHSWSVLVALYFFMVSKVLRNAMFGVQILLAELIHLCSLEWFARYERYPLRYSKRV